MSLPEQQDPESVGQAQSKELEFVHSVYEEIASHFSDTRYKVYRCYLITTQSPVIKLTYFYKISSIVQL